MFEFTMPAPRIRTDRPGPDHTVVEGTYGAQVAIPAMAWLPAKPATTYFLRERGGKWEAVSRETAMARRL